MGGAWVRANNGVGQKGGTGDEEMEKQRELSTQDKAGRLVVLPARGILSLIVQLNQARSQ